jgi:hypothetical protein
MAGPAPVGRNGGVSESVATSGQQTRQQLLNLVDRLIAEFPNQPAGVVIAQVAMAKERHRRTDLRGHRELVAVVEHAARQRILSAPRVNPAEGLGAGRHDDDTPQWMDRLRPAEV